jgi:hypothetical protein
MHSLAPPRKRDVVKARAVDLLGWFAAQTLGRLPIIDETRFRPVSWATG